MTRNLIEAQNWAEDVRDCVSKLELWSCDRKHGIERVRMKRVHNLLSFDPAPCNEPGSLKLKVKHILRYVCFVCMCSFTIELLTS